MKIVVLDGYAENPGDLSWKELERLGELIVYDRTPENLTAERMQGAEAVFTNKTMITKEIMEKCPDLEFLGILATGINVVDLNEADRRNIVVCNVPAYGTASVAQFTMALLLELCHHVGAHSDAVKKGEWSGSPDFCFWKYPLMELEGKTMGIIGYGAIGQAVARLACAFGMKVIVYSRHKVPEMLLEPGIRNAELEELYKESDVISLHCPLTEENRGLINADSLRLMKEGVFLINTARGPLVDEKALRDALVKRHVGGAAADVVSEEPIREDNPLLNAPNMILTPHIAWAPKEARQRLMDIAVENLRAYQNGQPVHVVNGKNSG